MIALLIKNWKLLLDIVVVVGAIILFTLFDPFGMFSKRELKGTANLISSVKGIGELVTAEYYGEVISSLNETIIFDIPPDTVTEKFEECYYRLKEECLNAIDDNTRLNKFLKSPALTNLKKTFNQNEENIYNHLIVLLAYNLIKPDESEFIKKNEELKGKTERRIINRLFDEIDDIDKRHRKNNTSQDEWEAERNEFLNDIPVYLESSANFHYQLNNMAMTKRERRHDIVFIGRGWVKAGYRFDRLDERNFAYDKFTKTLHFYGLSPVILDKDINPWFVPENKIKGFELVDYYRGATFEEAIKVKKKCKEKLLEQAEKADIMSDAQKNGEESLKNFFSLLLNEPDLKVMFHPLPHQNEINLIAADTLITVQEALLIDTIIRQYSEQISRSASPKKELLERQLRIFYNQFTRLPFIDSVYRFNIFSIEAARILEHKHYVLHADYEAFKRLRDTLRLKMADKQDTIFTLFTQKSIIPVNYPDFVNQFNEMAECLDHQITAAVSDSNLTVEITKQKLDTLLKRATPLDDISDSATDKVMKGDTIYVLKRKSAELPYRFGDLIYPYFTISDNFADTIPLTHLDKIESYITDQAAGLDYTTGNSEMDSLRKYELDSVITVFEHDRLRREVALKPVNKFIEFVRKPLK